MREFNKKPRFGGRDERPSFGRSSDRGDRGFDSPRRTEMHDVVCAKCGKDTTVPFRPRGNKPVLCRDCFTGGNGGDSFEDRPSRPFRSAPQSVDLSEIHEKLDRILDALKAR